jgi:hypothetical protein
MLIPRGAMPLGEMLSMSYAMITGVAVMLAAAAICYMYFKDMA